MDTTTPIKISCNDCEFAAFMDYGWSNWTVEGTNFLCMKGAHPDGEFDRWYGEDGRLEFAALCEQFAAGQPFYLDVDQQTLDEATPAQKAWFSSDAKGW